MKDSLEKCKWCHGDGYDQEHVGYKCWDCQGTGFKEGKKTKQYG